MSRTITRTKVKKRKRFDGPIHARLATARKDKDLTQKQVAAGIKEASDVDVDETLVSHWETGLARPPLSRLTALSKVLDIPVDTLIQDLMADAEAA